jgi:hypothetical protein
VKIDQTTKPDGAAFVEGLASTEASSVIVRKILPTNFSLKIAFDIE